MLYVTTPSALCIGRKRFPVKAMSGRGRKRELWVQFVYEYVEKEFERICELGVKVTSCILMEITVHSLNDAECPVGPEHIHPETRKLYKDLITYDFVYSFRLCSNIINRRKYGKNERSPEFTEWTERNIADHLGKLKRSFELGELKVDWVANIDETDFLYDLDDKNVLARRGENLN